MKKIISILLVLQFIFVATIAAYGNQSQSTVQMTMDGKLVKFHVVQLKLNDKLIKSDVPPVLYNERTMVPLRAIMENLDAEIEWDGENYQVMVKTASKEILLKIDSEVAMVNGEALRLPDDVPPKLINNSTMVPIRFIAETIGMEVGWEDETRTVLLSLKEEEEPHKPDDSLPPDETEERVAVKDVKVNINKGLPEIRIKTTGKVNYDEMNLTNPTRLVLDLKDVQFDIEDSKNLLANGSYSESITHSVLKAVRLSQFSKDPYVTRAVVEMNGEIGHEISFDEKTSELVIQFKNYVRSVKTELINLKEVVVIEGDFVENYNIIQLENPRRLVVDIKDSYLQGKSYEVNVNGRVAKGVRVAQFTPDEHYKPDDKIVRVAIDLQNGVNSKDFYYELKDHQLLIHLEGKPYSQISYQETGWTTAKLIFKGEGAGNYKVSKPGSNLVEVLISKGKNQTLEFSDINIGDHMIRDVKVDSSDKTNHRVLITLESDVELNVPAASNSSELVLELKNSNRNRQILVVIDPGHGGHDPGTTSAILNKKESEIVLDVALRLDKMLKEAGFRTYMTRNNDTYIALQDRSDVANQLKADLFISIHANASTMLDPVTKKQIPNPAPYGIETYYHPNKENLTKYNQSSTMAKLLQKELVKQLEGHDRGAKTANFFVLRETTMPAILTELGFLTNPEEEKKLTTESYRQKAAEALFNATVQYFEQTKFN